MVATLTSNPPAAPVSPASAAPAGRALSPAEKRGHPSPFHPYPEGTPLTERLPSEVIDHHHTAATWAAFIESDAVTEANAIYEAVSNLQDMLTEWSDRHGKCKDPGVEAIRAAGLTVPDPIARHGTELQYVKTHVDGLAWCLQNFIDWLNTLPDLANEKNTAANVRRLLGEPQQ